MKTRAPGGFVRMSTCTAAGAVSRLRSHNVTTEAMRITAAPPMKVHRAARLTLCAREGGGSFDPICDGNGANAPGAAGAPGVNSAAEAFDAG